MLALRIWLFFVVLASALFFGLLIAEYAKADTLQVTVAWKNVDTSRKILLEKGPSASGPFQSLAQLEAGTTLYVDATNAAGDRACYRMAYFDIIQIGPFSGARCKTVSTTVSSPPSSITVK